MTVPEEATNMRGHWDEVYGRLGPEQVSWYQPTPTISIELMDALGVGQGASVVDVGGGASTFAATLEVRGWSDLTVLDLSAVALAAAAGTGPGQVQRLQGDVLEWAPDRRYDLWHDRAVFHFLTDQVDRDRYGKALRQATHPGSNLIVATFAPDGPTTCSGLPVCRYGPEELLNALGGDLECVATRHAEHTTPWGGKQAFTWVAATVAQ